MSAPLIADGIYKILNVEYPKSAVDLIYANPNGQIAGYTDNDNTKNQQWRLRNLGDHKVTLENIAAPGAYASVAVQLQGSPLCGSENPATFIVRNAGQNKYRIATADGKYVCYLAGPFDYLAIELRPTDSSQGQSENAQFTFRRVQ